MRSGANVGRRRGAATQRAAIGMRARALLAQRPAKEAFVRIFVVALSVAIAALGATVAIAQGGDPKSARSIAATCANCHGTGGVSVGDIESLAGKPREEIVRKMQEFKSGARPATIMNQLAKGYTDEQIEALAGWFAAQKPSK
jgi:cytochrome c553